MHVAEVEKRIVELEKSAARVLELKRRFRQRRPIVIEFAGSPKAGKSSCISSLDIFLRRNNFRTKILTERASVCPIPNKFDPMFNVWTACAALNQLSETLAASSKKLDVIILDRGFFDALCWFEWQKTEGLLRHEDHRRFTEFFTSPRFRMSIDLVLMFTASPDTSSEREYRNLLTRKEGSIMRGEILSSYLRALQETKNRYKDYFRNIIEYYTDNRDQNTVSYDVTKQTISALKRVADEKIGFIPKSKVSELSNVFNYRQIDNAVEHYLEFRDRDEVEMTPDWLQLIPVAVLKDVASDNYLVGAKAQRATSSQSPEKGKVLCYLGGHVREEDATIVHSRRKIDVLRQCLYREVKEELGIDIDPDQVEPQCIWLRDGTKSEQHLAVVFVVKISISRINVSVDGEEFAKFEKKGRIGTGDILTSAEILKSKPDTWSKKILTEIIGNRLFSDDAFQKSLFEDVL